MAIVMETIQHKFNWFSLVVGVILFVAGIVTFIHLGTTLEFISIIIGVTAVVKGLYELWFKHVLDTTTEEKTLGLLQWESLISCLASCSFSKLQLVLRS